ncbi:hypothetical protein B4064_1232 [Caldibacillus thermoamylovorans]|jgi:hypothetical protein|uniref:Uncharacterized protein n=1 Tax=Caldibacillus thermoamylovorans TaxID=35841 RepID=A0A0D0G8J1_9BACI|nr:hypothetical protein B4065_2513 [Caldibacillus thermoamylovorans]KIO69472.1 hypothetical protein B4064_1232 [Caldibacillus thermoamylovorans]KIO70566.1 hypothetical protein B4166_1589 [Caldibacillus thermoamylovorans]KIO72376.1 hypothetical protein B4167_1066 [Caldibacillus thermoamylovorans]
MKMNVFGANFGAKLGLININQISLGVCKGMGIFQKNIK